ncbi:MAG TPA: hypothetical protein VF553_07165 [Pyrinomonadaceae bacterium]|jgi:hypothetical protein
MSLLSYVKSFQIQAPSGHLVAGLPIELVAAPTEVLDIPDVEVVTGTINLNVILKHVQLPAEAGPIKPWPPPATATSVLTNVTSGLAAAPIPGNIEGWLASITGTVPVGMRDVSGQLRIDFGWRFTDFDTGAKLGDVAVVGGAPDASAVTIALPPLVTEMTDANFDTALAKAPVTRRLGVQLEVRGRVGTTQDTGMILIPTTPLKLEIVPLPLPSVAALFRDQDLAGNAVLLMVPAGSPFTSAADLMRVLPAIKALVDKLDTAATLAAWATGTRGLLSAINALVGRLPLTKHIGFLARDNHKDLGKYNFIVVDWDFDDDMEDRGSSALIISASRDIHFFEHDDFKGKRLALEPVPSGLTRFGGVVVRRLHGTVPISEPPGCAQITGSPGGGWNDSISSYRWVGTVG